MDIIYEFNNEERAKRKADDIRNILQEISNSRDYIIDNQEVTLKKFYEDHPLTLNYAETLRQNISSCYKRKFLLYF